jgi:hypothetical protein
VSNSGAPRGELSVATPTNATSLITVVQTKDLDRFGSAAVACLIA